MGYTDVDEAPWPLCKNRRPGRTSGFATGTVGQGHVSGSTVVTHKSRD
jgi:hypothetical protein